MSLSEEEARERASSLPIGRRLTGYLQPGSFTVWPGGWHLAPPSFGPLLLLPGPKSGSAKADAGIASAPTASATDTILRIKPPLVGTGRRRRYGRGGSRVKWCIDSDVG